MVISNLDKYIAIGDELIVYSRTNLNLNIDLKVRYKINKEQKEIRLYDVPRILTFQEKVMIYYAILDRYYFNSSNRRIIGQVFEIEEYSDIENFIIRENGYTFHEFNNIDKPANGILGELIFEIPRQENEPEKLSRIRDIYEMLIRNKEGIGVRPICISFNGTIPDFKDIYNVIEYMLKRDERLSKSKEYVLFKRSGILGGNKRIFIVPKSIVKEENRDTN